MWYWLPGVIIAIVLFIFFIGRRQPNQIQQFSKKQSGVTTGRFPSTQNRSNAPKPQPGESQETPQGS